MQPSERTIQTHWYEGEPGGLLARIDEGLRALGKDPASLSVDDLMAVDEFHIRGREATAEVAELANLREGLRVVDVGSGLGGPSRFLATRYGCTVEGVDLTEEYCQVASAIAARAGLGGKVTYRQGNALDLPFGDGEFDLAWTQHISMNIEDKAAMFAEMVRVTRPGGQVVIYDPIKGPAEGMTYPVPWSRDGKISFLLEQEPTVRLLEETGLEIEACREVGQRSVEWFEANAPAPGAGPPPLGLHLLLGADWPEMARNMVQNVREKKLAVIQIVARKP